MFPPRLSTFNLSAQDHLFLHLFVSQAITSNSRRLTANQKSIRRGGAQDILFSWSELHQRNLLEPAQGATHGDFGCCVSNALLEMQAQDWEKHTAHFAAASKWIEEE